MRILGIDPGLRLTGFALLEIRPRTIEPALLEAGVIKLILHHEANGDELQAIWNGSQSAIFQVDKSTDGVTWTPLFNAESVFETNHRENNVLSSSMIYRVVVIIDNQ